MDPSHQRAPPRSSHFWQQDLQLCSPKCYFSDSRNILDSHYLQVKGLQMSQDHKAVLLMALVRWIDPVRSPLGRGQVLVLWEQAQGGVVSIAASEGGEQARLSRIYHCSRACLLFYFWFLKLKMFLSLGIAFGDSIMYRTFIYFVVFPGFLLPKFMLTFVICLI